MFISRIFIRPGGKWTRSEQELEQVLQKLSRAFAEFNPFVNAPNHFVELRGVDRETLRRAEDLLKRQFLEYDVAIEEKCTDAELSHAPYVPLLIDGEYIDEDKQGSLLNFYESITCKACSMVRDDAIPNPYIVSEERVRKLQDMYAAHNGIAIVSRNLAAFVMSRAGGCIQTGEVIIKESPNSKHLTDFYVWLRPKYSVGREVGSKTRQVCEACGQPIEVRRVETGDKFVDCQIAVEHFGDHACEIALSGSWYGRRTQERPMDLLRDIYISGELCFELLSRKVKGIVKPSKVVVAERSLR